MGSLRSCDDALLVVVLDTGLLRLSASVDSIPVEMLLDSRASHNSMSLDFVA